MTSPQIQTFSGILSDSKNTMSQAFRGPRNVLRAYVEVLEAFNSDGTDQLIIGHGDDDDAYVIAIDVSTVGVKTVTLGSGIGYDATAREVIAKYTPGGSVPTTGAVYFLLEWVQAPRQP